MRIGIQGGPASFHEMAARKYYGEQLGSVHCFRTFQQMVAALAGKELDAAMMAIENTVAGSILANYLLLDRYPVYIIGEIYFPISLHLMTVKNVPVEQIRTVFSHPMAIQQCQHFLENHPHLQLVETYDTADSAMAVKKRGDHRLAAIAGELAAERYGLTIIARKIETHRENYTRFLVLHPGYDPDWNQSNKASLSFLLPHRIGALADVLSVFKNHQLNLTKIQSMPILGRPHEYRFYVDLEWDRVESFHQALQEADPYLEQIKIYGIYRAGEKMIRNHQDK